MDLLVIVGTNCSLRSSIRARVSTLNSGPPGIVEGVHKTNDTAATTKAAFIYFV